MTLGLTLGCGPTSPPPPADTPDKTPEKNPDKIPYTPPEVPEVPEVPTAGDTWAIAAGPSELGEVALAEANEGPWRIRRPFGGRGGLDGAIVDDGAAPGGGLGLRGTGRGGGGVGEGSIGLGSAATIGHGSKSRPKSSAPPPPSRAEERTVSPTPTKRKTAASGASPPLPVAKEPLRAGKTDDNADFKGFLAYLETSKASLGQRFQGLDVADRLFVQVTDEAGLPLPGATIRLVDSGGRERWRATTYGDGKAPVYPRIAASDDPAAAGDLRIIAELAGSQTTAPWQGPGVDLVLRLPIPRKLASPVVEVVFIIDTTGSMGDEIAQVKATLLAVTDRLRGLDQGAELRYGAVLFRDLTDAYVTMTHPFTGDIQAFDRALATIEAGGGGDYPESVNQGIAQAVFGMPWQRGSAKIAFLIGDAPPQMQYKGDTLYGESAREAVAKGIRIHAIAASGLDPLGSLVFRQVAQYTRGKFIFIEYGRDLAGSAAAHGVGGRDLGGNNLDAIIYDQIREEIVNWGR